MRTFKRLSGRIAALTAFLFFLFANSLYAQTKIVTGIVKDKAGSLLAGASVSEKGTENSIVTDGNGLFKITVANENAILVFSFVGYQSKEMKAVLGGQMVVDLEQKTEDLSEVAVIAYGRQKKVTVVGAQSTIRVDDIKMPVRSVKNSLAGQLAGLVTVQRSGEPGYDDASIWIRGQASLNTYTNIADNPDGRNNANAPLIMIDGVPRSLTNINVEDIASFTILKDASATAVYGVRGANGVVIIETKKGIVATKPNITFDINQGFVRPTKLLKLADAATFVKMFNEAKIMRGEAPRYSDDIVQKYIDGSDPLLYPNVNWIKEVMKDWTYNRSANLNVSGGTKLANYYVGASYFEESGLYKTDPLQKYDPQVSFKRYTLTSNLSFKATNSTTVDIGVGGYVGTGNYPGASGSSIFNQMYITPPHLFPVRYAPDSIAAMLNMTNPYEMATQRGYVANLKTELRTNMKVSQKLDFLLEGLILNGLFAFDAYTFQELGRKKQSYTWYAATGRDPITNKLPLTNTYPTGTNYLNYSNSFSGNRKFYSEASLNYSKSFKRHDITGLILYNRSDAINNTAGDLISSLPFRSQGIAFRTTYAYDSKYMAEVNFGYTGSENFAPSKRYGLFPSVGVGYNISNEKFFDKISNVIQFLKLRATYGKSGDGSIAGRRFGYIGLASGGGGYTFGQFVDNAFGGNTDGEYAVNVGWETSTKTDIGIELKTLNSKLSIQADYFYDHRTGIALRNFALADYIGVINIPFGNFGETQNRGIDGTIEYMGKIGKVNMRFRGNFTYNKSKIIEDGSVHQKYAWGDTRGKKIGQRFGYIAEGLFVDSTEILSWAKQTGDVRPGDIKFKDLNGDGVIDGYDKTAIGYGAIPEIVYGFGVNLSYKNFDFSVFLQGVGNVDIQLNGFAPFAGTKVEENSLAIITDRWTPEKASSNQRPFYPRLSSNSSVNNNYTSSTWWITNGRYLRVKNAEIGYTVPEKLVNRAGLKTVRFYVNGLNLLTFSPFKLYDPELGDGRGTSYPLSMTISGGVNIRF